MPEFQTALPTPHTLLLPHATTLHSPFVLGTATNSPGARQGSMVPRCWPHGSQRCCRLTLTSFNRVSTVDHFYLFDDSHDLDHLHCYEKRAIVQRLYNFAHACVCSLLCSARESDPFPVFQVLHMRRLLFAFPNCCTVLHCWYHSGIGYV